MDKAVQALINVADDLLRQAYAEAEKLPAGSPARAKAMARCERQRRVIVAADEARTRAEAAAERASRPDPHAVNGRLDFHNILAGR